MEYGLRLEGGLGVLDSTVDVNRKQLNFVTSGNSVTTRYKGCPITVLNLKVLQWSSFGLAVPTTPTIPF